MNVIEGHELTKTRVCRIPNCPNEVRAGAPNRGPWANLCDEHHVIEVAKRREESGKPRAERTNGSGPDVSRESFEAKAKGLVKVGRRLDIAIRRYKPAKEEMEAAMEGWRNVCRALGGEDHGHLGE